tara:strand:+ start:972 stop:1472 length:501 start_codon:yes stop_codon:yes gene_type:complete
MNIALIIILTLFSVFARLIPHPPNFTPILAIALFAGMSFKNKYFFCIPLLAMLISDYFLGYHSSIIWVYISILLIFYLGHLFKQKYTFKNIFILSLTSSLIFFLITNFAVWVIGYPKSISGFIACYIAALPFFHNTLFSTMFYTFIFHISYRYLDNSLIAKKSNLN